MNHRNSRIWRHWGVLATGLCMAFASLGAAAQNAIEGVTGSIQGGSEVIRIDLTQQLTALPTGFTIQSPARVALDFPGVTNNMGRSMVDFNQGNLRSVNVVQAGDRTRVVLNLKQAAGYKAEIQGKSLLVSLDPAAAASPTSATASAASPTFAEDRNRDVLPLKDLDFRRTPEGAGKVVVNLANSQVGVDIRQQGPNLVVEFLKTSLPEGLRRRLDVGDFGTPIQTVTTFQNGDRVRMLIEPKGDWEHSAYQSDSQFVVEVRQRKVDPTKLSQGPGYSGEKLSLNFQNIEIRSLLQVIADFTNFNIITSDSVNGTVTLRLKDVPWDQALDIIMQTKNLGIRKNGNVLWIAPKDEITLKEKADLQSRIDLQNLEPLRTQSFQLNYTKAADIAAQLSGSGTAGGSGAGGGQNASILSPRGSVIAEPRTNQLFVSDIASRLERVQELITKLDIPVRQVLIEARIVEATDTFGKSLGIKLGGGAQIRTNSINSNIGSNAVVGSNATTSGQLINLPAVGQNAYDPATFAISLFGSNAARFISLELSALEADGKGKVVSSPRVVTADQTKALIEQGTELPYQVATSSGATSIAFRKANLKLEVTPQITPEGNIILDLDVNKDSVGQATSAGFAINTKHIKTQVLVENGGTVVIGGIFELNETDSETKVPGLGDIPVAGALFRTRSRSANKTEMLVFITPKMISDRAGAR